MNENAILFSKVFLRLYGKDILQNITWKVGKNESWVILGLNGAGKSTLARSIFEDIPITGNKSCIYSIKEIGYVSFDHEKNIHSSPLHINNATKLHLKKSRNLSLSSASTGEVKKFLLARALAKKSKLLILDEPFDGLDERSREEFWKLIKKKLKRTQLILITHRFDEIPEEISRVLVLHNGKVFASGHKEFVLNQKKVKKLFSHVEGAANTPDFIKNRINKIPEILIQMKNVTVRYSKKIVLNKINWTMKKGENWAIIGPNGAGKTTLLKLITGDNIQAYGQDIKIFGMQKGSGESMW